MTLEFRRSDGRRRGRRRSPPRASGRRSPPCPRPRSPGWPRRPQGRRATVRCPEPGAQNEVHDRGLIVDNWIGVGLDDDGGHPHRRRPRRGRADFRVPFGSLPPSAGHSPEVDKAGTQQGAAGVDHPHTGGKVGKIAAVADPGDQPLGHEQGARPVVARRRVDQAGVLEGDDTSEGARRSSGCPAARPGRRGWPCAWPRPSPPWSWNQADGGVVMANAGIDLHAAVHGARMHDLHPRGGQGELLAVLPGRPPQAEILAHRRHQRALHALDSQTQHHHHVGAGNAGLEIVDDAHPPPRRVGRNQRRRPDHAHVRPQHGEEGDVGSRHPAVQDVAADRHRQAADPDPNARRRLSASSMAWEGCSCWPSPQR